MKNNALQIFLILLITIISSCNTFNNSALINLRQGKNKVIDRDVASPVHSEEENEVADTETFKTTEVAIETLAGLPQPQTNPSSNLDSYNNSINFEENLDETDKPINEMNETLIEIQKDQNIISETFDQTEHYKYEPSKSVNIGLVVLLILGAVIVSFVLMIFFLLYA
ncbi:MAG: hypothetical protein GQ574_06540 [Crocinitomix sp.]|nr:hypothetical protein [Crocinitomix sp.]